jgi:hypothetical protein
MEEAASGELGGIRISGYNWADKCQHTGTGTIEMPEHRWISYYGLGIVSLHESRFSGRKSDASPTEVDSRTD